MRRKLIFGLLLFIGGIIMQEIGYIADIFLVRFVAGILWPIGMVIAVRASIKST